jgi:hypothetical protein
MMLESEILRSIRLALGNIPECVFQRCNNGVVKVEGRMARYGLDNGAADLIGCVNGRFEVKTRSGTQSEAQRIWQARMRRVGGIVEVVRSAEEAVAVVRRIIDGSE